MKTLFNEKTLQALIKDEKEASREYAYLANNKKLPHDIRLTLLSMARDEAHHHENLLHIKKKINDIKRLKKE